MEDPRLVRAWDYITGQLQAAYMWLCLPAWASP